MLQLCIFLLFSGSALFAKEPVKQKRAMIESGRVIQVKYSMPPWNNDSKEIDSGSVILRDANSGKLIQFQIEETAPDSGIFSGNYSVSFGEEEVVPEVYVIPNKQEISDKDLIEAKRQIDAKSLARKPIVVRKDNDIQILEVFDTKEQAKQALRVLKEIKQAKTASVSQISSSKAAKALFNAKELKKFADEQDMLARDEEKRRLDRMRQEEIEKQKLEFLQREQEKMNAEEQMKRKKTAIEYAESALDLFRVGKYSEAEKMFQQSFELDPNNLQYYFQYGITLFRNNKLNESIVALNIAKGPGVDESERLYFMGLAHYKLQEYDQSEKVLLVLESKKDKKLSPIASFYLGLIHIDQKKYELAKNNFQEVLDTSEDPQLDNRAEKKLDEIDRLIEFAKNKEKKFTFSATAGVQYDSNVLQISDTSVDQGSATDIASPRAVSGIGLQWRPIYEKNVEWGLKSRADYIYTLNEDLISTDPLVANISAPYVYKGKTFKKASKLEIKPGYEYMFLGQTGSGGPLSKLSGYFVDISDSLVMKDEWYLTPSLETRYDTFFDSDDQSGFKWTLGVNSIYYLNLEEKKGLISDFSFGMTHAKGESYQSYRIDLSTLYTTPMKFWDLVFAGGLYLYYLKYTETETYNLNYNAVANFSKSLSEYFDLAFVSNYMINSSNSDDSEYKKYTVGLTLTYNLSF